METKVIDELSVGTRLGDLPMGTFFFLIGDDHKSVYQTVGSLNPSHTAPDEVLCLYVQTGQLTIFRDSRFVAVLVPEGKLKLRRVVG